MIQQQGYDRSVPAGGENVTDQFRRAEVYDPLREIWNVTVGMTIGSDIHTATLLPNGKVLAADWNSTESYDPLTGVWTETASMNDVRSQCAAVSLSNGRVFIAGR